jgi:hypothetical protein
MRDPVRGLLIGPLVVPVGYWIVAMVKALVRGYSLDLSVAFRELTVVAAFGLPIAYAAAFVWGAPVLYALHRAGWLRATTVVATGAVGGTIVAGWFGVVQQGGMFRVEMPLLEGAALGALAGATCWWAGQGTASSAAPVSHGARSTNGKL